MDPNLFHLDWARVSEVLAAIVVLAFFVERVLAVPFESKWFIKRYGDRFPKELVAILLGAVVCVVWKFDAISMVVLSDRTTVFGELLTGTVIAGGSKASITLFHDVLGVRSAAHEIAHPTDPVTKKPDPAFNKAAVAAKL